MQKNAKFPNFSKKPWTADASAAQAPNIFYTTVIANPLRGKKAVRLFMLFTDNGGANTRIPASCIAE